MPPCINTSPVIKKDAVFLCPRPISYGSAAPGFNPEQKQKYFSNLSTHTRHILLPLPEPRQRASTVQPLFITNPPPSPPPISTVTLTTTTKLLGCVLDKWLHTVSKSATDPHHVKYAVFKETPKSEPNNIPS